MPGGKRSPSLSRDAIVEEAIRIIADEGLSGLTMRAVAARLGVTPMAAYYYVADKDELMRLVSERVSSSSGPLRDARAAAGLPDPSRDPWGPDGPGP